MTDFFQRFLLTLILSITFPQLAQAAITTAEELREAINNGQPGDTVNIESGVFEISEPLKPKPGMTIAGAGAEETVIKPSPDWNPGTDSLPDNQIDHRTVNAEAYLFSLPDQTDDLTISHLTLDGNQQLHGSLFGNRMTRLTLHDIHFKNALWCSVRTFRMTESAIRDNLFVNAGGRPGIDQGITGAAIFVTFARDSQIHNNVISRTAEHPTNFFGIKGRLARNLRIHHNTINVSFAIEFPFENDSEVEFDHNILKGVVSIPKFSGGPVQPPGRRSFWIHHNWIPRSYAIEWPRNGAEISRNLLGTDDLEVNGGHILRSFSPARSLGPTFFHDNLILNPGRGVYRESGPYQGLYFYNNHVKSDITARSNALFGLSSQNDFSTIAVRDNIIDNTSLNPRRLSNNTLLRNSVVENNLLLGISDAEEYPNEPTPAKQGPLQPFYFNTGAYGELTINQFKTLPSHLIGSWNFDELRDSRVPDRSISRAAGTLSSEATVDAGLKGQALRIGGSQGRVSLGDLRVNKNALSLSAWVRPEMRGDMRIISRAKGTAVRDHDWMLGLYSRKKGKRLRMRFRMRTDGKTKSYLIRRSNVRLNKWTHIAVTWNGHQLRFYQNGRLLEEKTQSGGIENRQGLRVAIGNQPLNAGVRDMKGLIDELQIFERSLSAEEIEKLYALGFPAEPIKPFAGSDLFDTSTNVDLRISAEDLLGNDTNLHQAPAPLTPVIITPPTEGTLERDETGVWTYSPNSGFSGTDSFTYLVNNGTQDSNAATVNIRVQPPPQLPNSTDIGSPPTAGSVDRVFDRYVVRGSGSDIFFNEDVFHFAHTRMQGDGEILARVVSGGTGKYGLMFRDSLAPDAANVMLEVLGDDRVFLQSRPETGGESQVDEGPLEGSKPIWLRLVRSGNTFQAYVSEDGLDWGDPIGETTVSLANEVFVGLAVTSFRNRLNEVVFDSVLLASPTAE